MARAAATYRAHKRNAWKAARKVWHQSGMKPLDWPTANEVLESNNPRHTKGMRK